MQGSLERLRKRREERRGFEGGFTLIELLIVVVILGILAAIVVFAVSGLTGNAAVASCKTDYKTVETASEAYYAQVGTYPSAITDLTGTATGSDGSTVGPWLQDSPVNTGHYQIELSGGGTTAPTEGVYTAPSGGGVGSLLGTTGTGGTQNTVASCGAVS